MVAALGLGRALGGLVHMVSTPESKGCTAPWVPKQPVRDQVCYQAAKCFQGPSLGPPWLWGTLQSDLAWLRQGWTVLQETCASEDLAGPAAGSPKSESHWKKQWLTNSISKGVKWYQNPKPI